MNLLQNIESRSYLFIGFIVLKKEF